ncbi:MAG: hypothetical protein AUK48_06925 [Oscillatoriales cyanobacterium CG2_30_44_21]|nr:MAG: hypothetical protein AUK48_06925 [Oscillatoriales cyanobacterium CG2_30_44_21]
MEVRGEGYRIWYEESTIYCQGALKLSGNSDYAPIVQLLDHIIDQAPAMITLNLRQLEILNSSGFNVLSKFIIKIRQKENIGITVKGAEATPWQGKSLKNLQRLMPSLKIEWQ